MTLAEERQAIAKGIADARKPEQLLGDLQSLESRRRKTGTLNELERRGTRSAIPGRSTYTAPTSTGGGIASPLVEQNTNLREYFPEEYLKSTDGLMWSRARPLKKIVMLDANGDSVVMEFKNGLSE
ncbi:hypothetical protein ACQCLI_05110 [Pseudomonas nitroreducens]|uniref:hypothetical protein n=1 Tax=Pseudomonas nitroreducens TaxID=46680 RepID=UPI000377623B|nr:hypothetical protein [Pseudomonas nitroreducens]